MTITNSAHATLYISARLTGSYATNIACIVYAARAAGRVQLHFFSFPIQADTIL